MKLVLMLLCLGLAPMSFAQTVIQADQNSDYGELCYLKQVNMKGYAYVNIVGACAWDPALNGLNLSLVAVVDPQNVQRIDLANVRQVTKVENKKGQIQISVIEDSMNENGDVFQVRKVIYIRSVSSEKGTFSVKNEEGKRLK